MKKLLITLTTLTVIFALASPVFAGKTNLYKNKREYIAIKHKSHENFNHPQTISQQQLADLLSKVQYKHCKFICVDQTAPEPAFTHHQIALLSQYAVKALEQANATELVEFFLATPETDFRRYTKGKLFILNNELHIIFDRLSEAGADNDPALYQQENGNWQVVARDHQRLQINPYGSAQKNWIVLSLAEDSVDEKVIKKR